MRSSVAAIPRLLALVSQFLVFAGFVVITGGLAKIQRTTNRLGSGLDDATVALYNQTYQSALLSPYPTSHGFQFSFIWFIIFFQFTLLLFTLLISLVPSLLHVGRPAALSLLAVALTLTINVVVNLTYFHRSDFAKQVYGKRDINTTYAGALLIVIGNGLTILALGTWAPVTTPTTTYPATTTAKQEAAVTHPTV